MILQSVDMEKETKINVKNIEQQYESRGMQAIRKPPEYWTTLGSSKRRSTEQANLGKDIIRKHAEKGLKKHWLNLKERNVN